VTNARTGTEADDLSDGELTVAAIEGVSKRFGEVAALDDCAFTVPAGAVTALVGPNGSGKTTLLRIVAGLLPPSSGRVETVEGERPGGYLPQNPAFRPAFTAEETLAFYADLLSTNVDVEASLARVGLAEVRDRRVEALSGGMTRLLGIAQATLGDPRLVVLDEPTGDLDPRMTEYVFEVAAELADEGMGVLLATHDLTGAAAADQLVVLDRGTVRASGTPEEVTSGAGADSLPAAFRSLVEGETGLTVRSGVEE
jgi:ABC-type multidrug transport system ATPase subunit